MELACLAAGRANDCMVAARFGFPAGPDRAGTDHPVEEPESEEGRDVAVDRDEVDARAAAEKLAVKLARPERLALRREKLEERAPSRRYPSALLPERFLGSGGEFAGSRYRHRGADSRRPPRFCNGVATRSSAERARQDLRRLGELRLRREQAHDQVRSAREVVEVAGLDEDARLQKPQRPFLLGRSSGNRQGRGPTLLAWKYVPSGAFAASLGERPQIRFDGAEDAPLEPVTQGEQGARGELHRSRDRQVRVRHQLQAREGPQNVRRGSRNDAPAELELGEPADLRQPREREGELGLVGGGGRDTARIGTAREASEHLVTDESAGAALARLGERPQLVFLEIGASRVTRTDDDDRPRRRRHRGQDRVRVEVPLPVPAQRVRNGLHALE